MELIDIISELGVPVSVCGASMYFIWRQTQFIQTFFMEDLQESHSRLEAIIVALINQQKQLQIDMKESLADMRSSYESLVEIVQALSGNGLNKNKKEKD